MSFMGCRNHVTFHEIEFRNYYYYYVHCPGKYLCSVTAALLGYQAAEEGHLSMICFPSAKFQLLSSILCSSRVLLLLLRGTTCSLGVDLMFPFITSIIIIVSGKYWKTTRRIYYANIWLISPKGSKSQSKSCFIHSKLSFPSEWPHN